MCYAGMASDFCGSDWWAVCRAIASLHNRLSGRSVSDFLNTRCCAVISLGEHLSNILFQVGHRACYALLCMINYKFTSSIFVHNCLMMSPQPDGVSESFNFKDKDVWCERGVSFTHKS
jgi:hypothetical protein